MVVPHRPSSELIEVLLIDDDEDEFVLTRDLLAEVPDSRFRLHWARTYDEGLAALEEGRHDVYLLDYKLGVRTGLDLLREAPEDHKLPPVIVLTGADSRDVDLAMMAAGAVGYLCKRELSGEVLDRSIRYALDRERREHERHAVAARLAEGKRMESLGVVAGGMAHTMNNLHTVILAELDLLSEVIGLEDQDMHESLEAARRATVRGVVLVRKLLGYSRRERLDRERLDLGSLVTEFRPTLREMVTDEITLSVVVDDDAGAVDADPGAVERMIVNLAENSVAALRTGGTIRLSVERADLDDAFCEGHRGSRPGEYVRLRVSDDGPGIDEAVLENLFEPRLRMSDESVEMGLGLGMVYGLVKQHDGYIDVATRPGQGTDVSIYFPRVAAAPAEEEAEKRRLKTAYPGEITIMVVDDEPAVVRATGKVLSRHGFRVLAARDGRDAVRRFREHPGRIDLVLTDVVMPAMNGLQLYETLKPEARGTGFLFMSGFSAQHLRDGELLPPGLTLLPKPWTMDALLAAVDEALAGAARSEEAAAG